MLNSAGMDSHTAHSMTRRSWLRMARGHKPEVVVALASLLALTLGLYQLDRRSFWLDEATTYYVSGVSWGRLLEIFLGAEHGWHPPTYFLALKAWRAVLGDSQVALRGMSLMFAVAAIPAIFLLARHLASRWTAALTAVLLACNAYVIQYAQEARTYTLTMLLAIVSYWLLVRALEGSSLWRWVSYAAVAILGVYSHLFFGLIVTAQAATVGFSALRPRELKGPLVGFGMIGVVTAPLLASSLFASGSLVNWIPPVTWDSLRRLLNAFSGGTPGTVVAYASGVLLALAWMIGPGRQWKWAAFVILWLLIPPAVLVAISMAKPVFLVRYLIISLPALVILVAIGLTRIPAWASVALCGIVLVTSAFGVTAWYATTHPQWRELAAHLDERGRPQDGVALWSNRYRKPLTFQVGRLTSVRTMPSLITPPIPWRWNSYGRSEAPRTNASARFEQCDFRRVWLVGGPRKVASAQDNVIANVLSSGYRREKTVRIGDRNLHLFVRNGNSCLPGT
jgi:mannosyltransferase